MLSPAAADIVAVCGFAAAGVFVAALIVRGFRRSPFRPAQTVLWWLNYLLTRLLWRTHVKGRFDLPPGRGAVIVANHRSSVDPFFIEMGIPRVVHWMVAKEYCEHPAFRWFLKNTEAIPTSRGGIDTASTKRAIRLARDGGLVGVFPEGRINDTPATLLPGRLGAVLIALRARVPIVPCHLAGAPFRKTPWSPLLMPARVCLTIGQPIDLTAYFDRENDRDALEEIARRILVEIARLGGHEHYQPTLAGRHNA